MRQDIKFNSPKSSTKFRNLDEQSKKGHARVGKKLQMDTNVIQLLELLAVGKQVFDSDAVKLLVSLYYEHDAFNASKNEHRPQQQFRQQITRNFHIRIVDNTEKYRISNIPEINDAQNCMAGSFTASEGGFFLSGTREGNSLNSITRSLNFLNDNAHWKMYMAKTITQLS
jgi:hypothetical protein